MSEIRYLKQADMPEVTKLFQKIFRDPAQPPPAELTAYLQRLYMNFADEDTPATKVLINDHGSVCGFLGVNTCNYIYEGKTLRTAIAGALMVDNHEQDPMGGARLMRSLIEDDYDLIITETASEVTAQMWKKLNAIQLADYSLEWLRIISPLSFAVETAASKIGALRLLRPVAARIDRHKRNNADGNSLRWSLTPQDWPAAQSLICTEIEIAEFIALYRQFSSTFAAHPQWSDQKLACRLEDAQIKPDYGRAYMVKAATKTGKAVGLFLYYLHSGQTARVLELFSHPKAGSQVIDALIHHAAQQGAVAIRGRTQPEVMEAMLGKRIAFTHLASTMVWAKDRETLTPFLQGTGLANGLAGELWSRLSGNPF